MHKQNIKAGQAKICSKTKAALEKNEKDNAEVITKLTSELCELANSGKLTKEHLHNVLLTIGECAFKREICRTVIPVCKTNDKSKVMEALLNSKALREAFDAFIK